MAFHQFTYIWLKSKSLIMKYALTLIIFAVVQTAFSQPLQIVKHYDDMTDETMYTLNKDVYVTNDKDMGILLQVVPQMTGNHVIRTVHAGIGQCCEKNELIILLEDGQRWKVTAFNQYNCEAEGLYWLSSDDLNLLKSSPMKKIRVTNGVNLDNYTEDVNDDEKLFFNELFEALESLD